MSIATVTPQDIRTSLLLRQEIALLDVRQEAAFATAHPLFAANMAADRIALEAAVRLPRKDVPIVLYDDGEGLVAPSASGRCPSTFRRASRMGPGFGSRAKAKPVCAAGRRAISIFSCRWPRTSSFSAMAPICIAGCRFPW